MQFNVDDSVLFAGKPTSSILLTVEYFDEGFDAFSIQYDGLASGPKVDGRFTETRDIFKTNTLRFKKVTLVLNDVFFQNRDNTGDLRIGDHGDGAETIRSLEIDLRPNSHLIYVNYCGADPYDNLPDSDAIQQCIDQARTGDTIKFQSGENSPDYVGYLIDKTIFLEPVVAQKYLTFTSTDPLNPALLKATPDLKGFVVRLYSRVRTHNPGQADYLTLENLHLDGNRAARTSAGNWGTYVRPLLDEMHGCRQSMVQPGHPGPGRPC